MGRDGDSGDGGFGCGEQDGTDSIPLFRGCYPESGGGGWIHSPGRTCRAETGVVMLGYTWMMCFIVRGLQGKMKSVADLREAIIEGAAERVRPKIMTVATTLIGLLPVMWGNATGSQVMKRIAAPMGGGI